MFPGFLRSYKILILFIFSFAVIDSSGTALNGNYTINSAQATGGTNFQSFNSFADSINLNGISGNVIVTVVAGSGPYIEQVVFDSIAGTNPGATIILDGNGELITAVTSTINRHIIRLKDIQYFTITNLHIAWNPGSAGGFYGIHLFNTGQNISITNCDVDLTGTTSTLYGAFVASGSETSILTTGDFHSITISGNTATGGGYGASVFGLISNLASGIIISGNHFYDFHSNGVYLRETDGAEISNNLFDKRTANVTSTNAIQIAQSANINARIFNNFISVSQVSNGTSTIRGIYLFDGSGHKVYNNVIYNIQLTSGNFTGIEVRTGATAPEIYFNTISIDNPTSGSGELYGIAEELSNTNSFLRNNLISITQTTTGIKAGLVLGAISTVTSALSSDHNLIYIPGGNVALKNSLTPLLFPSMADWQAASSQDANSISADPLFVSTSTLPQPTNLAIDNLGTPIIGITTDVLGSPRSTTPDLGAYEFGAVGITENEKYNVLECYPNPVSDKLFIQLPQTMSEGSLITVYEITGKKLLEYNIENKFKREFISLETNLFPPGVFFLQIKTSGKIYESHFIKE